MDLRLESLDAIEAPMSDQEGIGWVLIAFGTGLLVGVAIAT